MQRRRPRQHPRRLQSGKRVVVNRGIFKPKVDFSDDTGIRTEKFDTMESLINRQNQLIFDYNVKQFNTQKSGNKYVLTYFI